MTSRNSSQPANRASKTRFIVATLLSLPFLSLYWLSLSRLIPDAIMVRDPNWLTPLSIILYVPFALCAALLFSNVYTYLLVTCASLAASATGLIKNRSGKLLSGWFVLLLCATLAFPLLLRYEPALTAAPGYTMQWLTKPGFLAGIIKAAQNVVEKTPCEYQLLGWGADERLYYQANCDAEVRVWQYTLGQSDKPAPASSIPADLSGSTVPKSTLLDRVHAHNVRPKERESATRPLLLNSEGLASTDGQWIAVIIQHIYGPQDVIVLTKAE